MNPLFFIDPTRDAGRRIGIAEGEEIPKGVLRPGMIEGLILSAFSLDGNAGQAWAIGQTVLFGRYLLRVPGFDDHPRDGLARVFGRFRFPQLMDGSRMGHLARTEALATGHAAAACLRMQATKHAAEVAAILARTPPEPGTVAG